MCQVTRFSMHVKMDANYVIRSLQVDKVFKSNENRIIKTCAQLFAECTGVVSTQEKPG